MKTIQGRIVFSAGTDADDRKWAKTSNSKSRDAWEISP